MKLFTVDKIKRLDELTMRYEPISEVDLMERAAQACTHAILSRYGKEKTYIVVAGRGNNGGDGLAIARQLCWSGCAVEVFVCAQPDRLKPATLENFHRARQTPRLKMVQMLSLTLLEQALSQTHDAVVIDAIYGTGLIHPIAGLSEQIVELINSAHHPVISIDVPSGLMETEGRLVSDVDPSVSADVSAKEVGFEAEAGSAPAPCVVADWVLTLHAPKLSLLMPGNGDKYKSFTIVDIGIHPRALVEVESPYEYIEGSSLRWMLKERGMFAHKGVFGHGMLIAGSFGMMGAAILAARSALRSGLGMLTVHVPRQGVLPMQTAVPEAILSIDFSENTINSQPASIDKYPAIAIGCGLGRNIETYVALKEVMHKYSKPIVLDADALFALSRYPESFSLVPKYSILTPHPLEFQRLVGHWKSDDERLSLQRHLAMKHHVIVVLKGAFTSVALPDGHVYFNSTGNPGMATAGSGDVLTGLLLGLLCQGYAPATSAILGVYLHGLAGDIAASKTGQESLIASDIIAELGAAYLKLKNNNA